MGNNQSLKNQSLKNQTSPTDQTPRNSKDETAKTESARLVISVKSTAAKVALTATRVYTKLANSGVKLVWKTNVSAKTEPLRILVCLMELLTVKNAISGI